MFRLALCLSFVLTVGLRAQEKPPLPKPSPLLQGTAKVQNENLVCVVYMTRNVEKEVDRIVFEQGKAVAVKQKYTVVEIVPQQRILPLKGLQGYVVGARKDDVSKAFTPLDPSKLPQLVQKEPHVFFVVGEKPTVGHVADLKAGNVIFVLPKEDKKP